MTISQRSKHTHKHTHKHEQIINNTYEYHTHIHEYLGLYEWFKKKIKGGGNG